MQQVEITEKEHAKLGCEIRMLTGRDENRKMSALLSHQKMWITNFSTLEEIRFLMSRKKKKDSSRWNNEEEGKFIEKKSFPKVYDLKTPNNICRKISDNERSDEEKKKCRKIPSIQPTVVTKTSVNIPTSLVQELQRDSSQSKLLSKGMIH